MIFSSTSAPSGRLNDCNESVANRTRDDEEDEVGSGDDDAEDAECECDDGEDGAEDEDEGDCCGNGATSDEATSY
jgi:hypothetical protein